MGKPYFCYIVRCSDGTLYTGITTDVERRVKQHNAGKGAKYTSVRGPVVLIYQEPAGDRSSATIRERKIKRLPHAKKLSLTSAE